VRDLLESREVWPVAVYLLVWCAASMMLLITQAAFSHAVATGDSVSAPGTEQSPLLIKAAASIVLLRCKLF